jgi:hypothetical protein
MVKQVEMQYMQTFLRLLSTMASLPVVAVEAVAEALAAILAARAEAQFHLVQAVAVLVEM